MKKMHFHPTCQIFSLTMATKMVAFLDMLFGLFGLVWFVVMLASYNIISLDPFDYIVEDSNSSKNGDNAQLAMGIMMENVEMNDALNDTQADVALHQKIVSLSLAAFYTVINLIVFVLLLVGIYRKSAGMCLEWFHIRCAIFFFKLIILIMYLMGGNPMYHLYHHIPFLFSMLIHLYGLWIVHSYVNELKELKLKEQIEACRKQREIVVARESFDELPRFDEIIRQKRISNDQIKKNLFDF